ASYPCSIVTSSPSFPRNSYSRAPVFPDTNSRFPVCTAGMNDPMPAATSGSASPMPSSSCSTLMHASFPDRACRCPYVTAFGRPIGRTACAALMCGRSGDIGTRGLGNRGTWDMNQRLCRQRLGRRQKRLPSLASFLLVDPFGSLVLWFPGSLVPWFPGSLVLWFPGSLVLWFSGSLVPL